MLERTDHYAVDIVLPSVESLTDRSTGSEANCRQNQMILQCIDSVIEMLMDPREVRRVERELLRLRSQIEHLRRVFQK